MQTRYHHRVRRDGMFFVAGLIVACVIALASAAASSEEAGRYQCCPAGDNMSSVYVLDTKTGQTWLLTSGSTLDMGTPWERKALRTSVRPVPR